MARAEPTIAATRVLAQATCWTVGIRCQVLLWLNSNGFVSFPAPNDTPLTEAIGRRRLYPYPGKQTRSTDRAASPYRDVSFAEGAAPCPWLRRSEDPHWSGSACRSSKR